MARILIDALGADSPGAQRHLEGFLPALGALAGGHRFRLVVRQSSAAALADLAGPTIEFLPIANARSRPVLPRLWIDLVHVPLHARRERFDLIVTLANFGPVWTPVPHVVFQRNAMHFSPEFLGRVTGLRYLEWRLRGLLTVAEMRFATLNVTPTDAMAKLILAAHPSLAGRPFRTLPHGTDLSRFAAIDRGEPASPFVFLYPTKIETYKGLEILLDATRRLAESADGFELHVTAPDLGWPREIQAAIDAARGEPWFDRLRFVGPQPADRMPELYRSADAVVYPSLCESFGFPLLESMASGLPIVAGDLEVNRELCGEAAEYYTAKSAQACAAGMKALLDEPDRRRRLAAASRARIAGRDWSWERYARQFVELCEGALVG